MHSHRDGGNELKSNLQCEKKYEVSKKDYTEREKL